MAKLVLIHGLLGFNEIGVPDFLSVEYFRGVRAALARIGVDPLVPQLPGRGTVAGQAAALATELQKYPNQDFVLCGHSMGGLDACHLAAHLDPEHRVKIVVTVGTPHRGSPVARLIRDHQFAGLVRLLGGPALADLDPATRTANPIPKRDDVRYISYAGVRQAIDMAPPLKLSSQAIPEDNDGLVGVSSAPWGEFRGVLRADHFELVGWRLPSLNPLAEKSFDHIGLWRGLAAEFVVSW